MSRAKLLLISIFILAAVLRFAGLAHNPPSLSWDEVSHGYNAYSILKTGQDEWGQAFPLANFRAYGDYPLPLYMYLSMPGISFLGLNEFSIRFPSALFGTLLVLLGYFLAKTMLKRERLALLTALLIAISPWSLLTSRQALQATPSIFFLTLGIWLFLKKDKGKWLPTWGTICLGLSAYAYHNTRILAPLLFVALLLLYKDTLFKSKQLFLSAILVATIFFMPLIFILTSEEGSARATWVGILNQGAINQINESRGNSSLAGSLPRFFYNKVTYFALNSASNYIGYFSPKFLFFEGGTHYQFSIPHFGILYPVTLPFFYLGLIVFLLRFRALEKEKRFILIWLLLAPLPAAITRDPYQAVRAMTMITPVFLVTSFGFGYVADYLKNKDKQAQKFFWGIFALGILLSFMSYIYQLWTVYPIRYSFAWQYGYKQIAEYIKTEGIQYQKIYISKKYGEPHEFLLFYLSYDPSKYRNDPNLIRYGRSNWFWVDRFGKFEFLNNWEVKEKVGSEQGEGESLLITSPGNYPEYGHLIKTIYFLDGNPAFDIVELAQVQY